MRPTRIAPESAVEPREKRNPNQQDETLPMTDDTTPALTDAEEAALAPYLDDLHPADIEAILLIARRMGLTARDWRRRGETEQPYVNTRTPDVLDAYRRGIADMGAVRFKLHNPQKQGTTGGGRKDEEYAASAADYGMVYLAASEALRAIYLDDDATADASLAALDTMGATTNAD